MASFTGGWVWSAVVISVILNFILVYCDESPSLETVFPAKSGADNIDKHEFLSDSPTKASSHSSPSSESSTNSDKSPVVNTDSVPEDGTGHPSVQEEADIQKPNSSATSRAITFEELIFGVEKADRSDLTFNGIYLDEQNRSNGTDKPRRIHCVPKNLSSEDAVRIPQHKVQIMNSTELLLRLSQKNETHGNCAVVMFYAPWCMFCARAAPHYNALARAFPQLDVLAIDAAHFSSLNSRYGTIAVPNILVFHNAKAVARFNSSSRTFNDMVSFVGNVTGLNANESATVLLQDYQGPLSSVPTNDRDLLLWLSWLFVLVFSGTVFAKSPRGQLVWNFIVNFGAEHEHID